VDSIFLLKYSKAGSQIWNRTWGGESSEVARAVAVSPVDSRIYIGGNTMSYGKGDFDVVLLVYDLNGALLLNKTWGGTQLDQAHGIAVHYPYVYVVGETRSYGAGNEDEFLFKVDPNGENVVPEFSQVTLIIALISIAPLYLLSKRRKFHHLGTH
jgi:hypothetical protein